jgi:hypothetical protein
MRSGPLIRSWSRCPFLRSIQATGAPSGVTKSAELIALACAGVRRAVMTLCTLQMQTVLLSLLRAHPKMQSTASLQLTTSTGTRRTSSRIRLGERARSCIRFVSRWLRTKAAIWWPATIRMPKSFRFNCHSERSELTCFVREEYSQSILRATRAQRILARPAERRGRKCGYVRNAARYQPKASRIGGRLANPRRVKDQPALTARTSQIRFRGFARAL